ncbi:hypothetical protein AB0C60_02575, partial [Streptomyces sp. NPDC048845]
MRRSFGSAPASAPLSRRSLLAAAVATAAAATSATLTAPAAAAAAPSSPLAGIAVALPDGYAAFVHPRSGLAAR